MFRNGATKPILEVTDADVTNEPCLIAGLGCINQLSKISEVGLKIAKQGVVKVLEKALHRIEGVSPQIVREKAIYSLSWLSRIPQVRKVLSTKVMIDGLSKQFSSGSTLLAKCATIQILMNLHGSYPKEEEIVLMRNIRDEMVLMLEQGQWQNKNLLIKGCCVLYRENEDKMYLVEKGIIEIINRLLQEKPEDLAEACIVLLLSLSSHPDIPWLILDKGTIPILCRILRNLEVPVITDLLIILLKSLCLYNHEIVERSLEYEIPVEKSHLKNLESPECTLYGSEYGGLVLEYLQNIVNNRRDQKYLLTQFEEGELKRFGLSDELIDIYQKSFMELDLDVRGYLEVDALRVIMVLKGEVLDDDELQDIFNEYDPELTGKMDFKQFVHLMSDWKKRFGFGTEAIMNQVTNSGMIGRARRMFGRWWNKDAIAQEQIMKLKQKREEEKKLTFELAAKYMVSEKVLQEREKQSTKRSTKSPGK